MEKSNFNSNYALEENKDYTFEEILALLPEESEKTCVVDKFLLSLEFIKTVKEFRTVDMQCYLKCGYGDVCRIIDALRLLGAIRSDVDAPARHVVT